MIRATTNGVLKGYRSNLNKSFVTLNKSRDTVLSQRTFNSYAEDPAAASQAFKLRRSYVRTNSQITTSDTARRKFNTAWGSMDSVIKTVDNITDNGNSAFAAVLSGETDTTAGGRAALGQQLEETAESIVQTMNAKYGDTFTFAGADGLQVPFSWSEPDDKGVKHLLYRGIPVDTEVPKLVEDTANPGTYLTDTIDGEDCYVDENGQKIISKADYETAKKNLEQLDYLAKEKNFADIGLGLQEDEKGRLIESSAFNVSIPGISFLGYGVDEDGDPKNVASIIQRMGTILSNCDKDDGEFVPGEREEYERLINKLHTAGGDLHEKHVELDVRTTFLNNNHKQLETISDNLNEQFLDIEQVNLAEAITSFSWAQYCYNAALKVGNSILSQSLIDYMS